jgi:N utilization substance protein B
VKSGRPGGKSTRRRARELALQGLYQHFVGAADAATIDGQMREQAAFAQCDEAHFKALVQGSIDAAAVLDGVIARHADRKISALSPIEHGALWIGIWELMHCIDIPYKVVINEAVELTKSFGGTDGHKYVNGVLDKAAAEYRAAEVQAARSARGPHRTPT